MKYYTGIGSRETPEDVLYIMKKIALYLARQGYILRSGGAHGADLAFEEGCDIGRGEKEIFLPWPYFNNHPSPFCYPSYNSFEVVDKFHPSPNKLSNGARKLHARNTHQVLGKNLIEPSEFIICWTGPKGGTQQALRIADYCEIPIYNLKKKGMGKILKKFLIERNYEQYK